MAAKRSAVGVGKSSKVWIGTSGWHYAGWWGPFYPKEVKKKDALAYYTTRFRTTELNAPFYRTPTEKAVKAWRDGTPEDFCFAWKASRFITHYRRLTINENSMQLLESRVKLLGEKLGPVLFQLPPNFKADRERLAGFLKRVPKRRRYSFEFRHVSWYEPPILDLLSEYNASLCLSDHAAAPAPTKVTADWVYVRLHGTSGRYEGSYPRASLRRWADLIREWQAEGRLVWCFFDNDVKSAAPHDAERLVELLGS